jgi:serine protease AprX
MEINLRHTDVMSISRTRMSALRDTHRPDVMRRGLVLLAAAAIFGSFAATAGAAKPAFLAKNASAFVPASLTAQAQANPDKYFNVIVRGRAGESSASIASKFPKDGALGKVKKAFYSVNGVAGTITGKNLLKLAADNHVFAIVPDMKLTSTGVEEAQLWKVSTQVDKLWGSPLKPAPQAPAIAVVDSGIDTSKLGDFGARVIASVNMSSVQPNATGDDEGHGTMVAGIAAGASSLYPGVAQNAPLVSVRTADATGASRTSDVIAGIDWILANKDRYNIRVANFSMGGGGLSSFMYDPLDAAVESLWFHGVVVVTSVGNYGTNMAMTVKSSPGNDPFVISVGALDTNGTSDPSDDFAAPWSVYGHTVEGFAKPELSAPGRWIAGPIPTGSTLALGAPDRVLAPGYMWMSGTSLAAPQVAGAAAQLLALHPSWTPDQVKGALIRAASKLKTAAKGSGGFGELNLARAAAIVNAPSAQDNLSKFVKVDSNTGQPYFDAAAWVDVITTQTDWSETDWSETDWSETDWSETDWSETDWSETDWSETDWSETDWSETDWSETDWSETDWSETDWSETDWSESIWSP